MSRSEQTMAYLLVCLLIFCACKPSISDNSASKAQDIGKDTSEAPHPNAAALITIDVPSKGNKQQTIADVEKNWKHYWRTNGVSLCTALLRGPSSRIVVTAAHCTNGFGKQHESNDKQNNNECDDQNRIYKLVCVVPGYLDSDTAHAACTERSVETRTYWDSYHLSFDEMSDHDAAALIWPDVMGTHFSGLKETIDLAARPATQSQLAMNINGARYREKSAWSSTRHAVNAMKVAFMPAQLVEYANTIDYFDNHQYGEGAVQIAYEPKTDYVSLPFRPFMESGDSGGPGLVIEGGLNKLATINHAAGVFPYCPLVKGCQLTVSLPAGRPNEQYAYAYWQTKFLEKFAYWKKQGSKKDRYATDFHFSQYIDTQALTNFQGINAHDSSRIVFFSNKLARVDLQTQNGKWLARVFRHCDVANPAPNCDQLP